MSEAVQIHDHVPEMYAGLKTRKYSKCVEAGG